MAESGQVSTGVVVPTLGTRPQFLAECISSIRRSSECMIVVVIPSGATIDASVASLVDLVVDDPLRGLAAAINAGMQALPWSVRYATWLGDDDRLTDGSLDVTRAALEHGGAAFVFGGCRYIDTDGKELWVNRSGRWAVPLMRFGPQLVPQPGSLFDRRVFDELGGLDERFKWAFDLDLFLRLVGRGRTVYLDATLAEFRWHDGSLSVGGRAGSVAEASSIRRRALPRLLRPLSFMWEPLLRRAILFAGDRMNSRLTHQ